MADSFIGDKFVVEIESYFYSPSHGTRYCFKGVPNIYLTDDDLAKLEKYQKPKEYKEPRCRDCVYSDVDGSHYPCSICYRGDPKEEMFSPK